MTERPQLPVQSEKALPYAIRPHLLAYCSRTDLFAIVTRDEAIEVYRLGGQRAFSVKRKSPSLTIVGIQWIRDGKCLAVALSNGHVDIVSGESGKTIRHGGDDPFSNDSAESKTNRGAITCLGWGTVLTKDTTNSIKTPKPETNDSMSEEWLTRLFGRHGIQKRAKTLSTEDDLELQAQKASTHDLPRQLAFIDVESVLPRLSPIPARTTAGGRYEMFATQAALDDYFNSMQRKDRLAADVMFVGHSSGHNRVIVDDILEIKYNPPPVSDASSVDEDEREEGKLSLAPLSYASHPRSKQHALLRAEPEADVEDVNKGYRNLTLSLFDIPLMASGGSHLHLIVSRTAQLRDLCGYITYSIICAKSDWTTHTNLPSRFMENVNETLEEKDEGVLEHNLYHLAMTGNFSLTILEWLRDELAERGHKRWDHAMTTLYTDLSKILLTNLLPVLERSAVVATNLRGLSRYYIDSTSFSVPPETFTSILSTLSSLQLLVHEAVQILGTEQRQFRAFSKWLRHQIDLAAADPESLSAKDMAEREAPNLDLSNVLAYLEGGLTKSRLKYIVHATPEAPSEQATMQELVASIHAARDGEEGDMALMSLHTWSAMLNHVCKEAHQHISIWQQSSHPHTTNINLATPSAPSISPALDIRMLQTSPGITEIFVLAVPSTPEDESCELALWNTRLDISDPKTQYRPISLPSSSSSSKITTLKFLDDETFLAVLRHDGLDHLLCLPYRNPTAESEARSTWHDIEELRPWIAHTFEKGFVPAEMRGNGRKGRRNVVVVETGRRRWKVLDLEGFRASVEGKGVEAEEEDEDEEEEGQGGEEDSMVFH